MTRTRGIWLALLAAAFFSLAAVYTSTVIRPVGSAGGTSAVLEPSVLMPTASAVAESGGPDSPGSARAIVDDGASNRGRFPQYGTDAFLRRCPWAVPPSIANKGCTFLARPQPTEGVAAWMAQVAEGYIVALQGGCRLLADYGPGVDIGAVLAPADVGRNWTAPDGFACRKEDLCFSVEDHYGANLRKAAEAIGRRILPPPRYRFLHNRGAAPGEFDELGNGAGALLPGFRAQDGMACAINGVFALDPSMAAFVPRLFSEVLPAVREEGALVLALYVRTGNTDYMAQIEKWGKASARVDRNAKSIVRCALRLEGEILSARSRTGVVWVVITDLPSVGQEIASRYNNSNVAHTPRENSTNVPSVRSVLQRRVLTTSTRGMQTRPARRPSTYDFAEAIVDWFLLGESDAVIVASGLSFGATGAMRTARPIYDAADRCKKKELFRSKRIKPKVKR